MRLCIASLLLALFAFQALPLVALGKAFAKTQWELADDDAPADDEGGGASDSVKVKKEVAVIGEDFLLHSHTADFCSVQVSCALFLHRADHLPVIYAGEVATPPPNHC